MTFASFWRARTHGTVLGLWAVRSSVPGPRHVTPRTISPGPTPLAADIAEIPIDPNGNLTFKTEGTDVWGYEWNGEGQLTRVTKNGIEQARFAYDPFGRRVEKVAGGMTTSYTYDKGNILREIRGSATLKYISAGTDEPLAVDEGTGISYFHADGLGSIMKATNSAGGVVLTRQYDAWGNLQVAADQAGYAYTGREWDPETGLYYYRARYYDPRGGRFISEDPIRFDAGPNFYAYVDDDPIGKVDPNGMAGKCWTKRIEVTRIESCSAKVLKSEGPCPGEYLRDICAALTAEVSKEKKTKLYPAICPKGEQCVDLKPVTSVEVSDETFTIKGCKFGICCTLTVTITGKFIGSGEVGTCKGCSK